MAIIQVYDLADPDISQQDINGYFNNLRYNGIIDYNSDDGIIIYFDERYLNAHEYYGYNANLQMNILTMNSFGSEDIDACILKTEQHLFSDYLEANLSKKRISYITSITDYINFQENNLSEIECIACLARAAQYINDNYTDVKPYESVYLDLIGYKPRTRKF